MRRHTNTALAALYARGNRPLVYSDSISRDYAARHRRAQRVAREQQRTFNLGSERYAIDLDTQTLTRIA